VKFQRLDGLAGSFLLCPLQYAFITYMLRGKLGKKQNHLLRVLKNIKHPQQNHTGALLSQATWKGACPRVWENRPLWQHLPVTAKAPFPELGQGGGNRRHEHRAGWAWTAETRTGINRGAPSRLFPFWCL